MIEQKIIKKHNSQIFKNLYFIGANVVGYRLSSGQVEYNKVDENTE